MKISNRKDLPKQIIYMKIKKSKVLKESEINLMGIRYNLNAVINMENANTYKALTNQDKNHNALNLFKGYNKKEFSQKCKLINSIIESGKPVKNNNSTNNFGYRYKIAIKLYKELLNKGYTKEEIESNKYSF